MQKTTNIDILISAKGVRQSGKPAFSVSIHLDETGFLVRTSERVAGQWITVDETYVLNVDQAFTFQQLFIQNLRGISNN